MTEVDNENKFYFSVISLMSVCKKMHDKQMEEKVPIVMTSVGVVISINDSRLWK